MVKQPYFVKTVMVSLFQDALLGLTDREDRLAKRFAMIKESATQVHNLLKVT